MTHYGSLGTQPVSDDVHDVRGTTVRGSDGGILGEIVDVIFDHDSMEIRYLVVDGSGWSEAVTFLLPAGSVSKDENHADGFATDISREEIENSPRYDKKSLNSEDEWKKYEQEFKEYWEEGPVMHMKDFGRVLIPPEAAPAKVSSIEEGRGVSDSSIDVSKLFPERLTSVFPDPAPSGGKVTLRPKSVARTEEAASGVALLKPHWWESFENYLRDNKSDIQAKCPQCNSKAA